MMMICSMPFVARQRGGRHMKFPIRPGPHLERKSLMRRTSRAYNPTAPSSATRASTIFRSLRLSRAPRLPHQHEFGRTDGDAAMECPIVDSHFHAWQLPKRNTRRKGCRIWKMRVRLGPNASGAGTNYAISAAHTNPALRATSARGVANFLQEQAAIGPPPTAPSWQL